MASVLVDDDVGVINDKDTDTDVDATTETAIDCCDTHIEVPASLMSEFVGSLLYEWRCDDELDAERQCRVLLHAAVQAHATLEKSHKKEIDEKALTWRLVCFLKALGTCSTDVLCSSFIRREMRQRVTTLLDAMDTMKPLQVLFDKLIRVHEVAFGRKPDGCVVFDTSASRLRPYFGVYTPRVFCVLLRHMALLMEHCIRLGDHQSALRAKKIVIPTLLVMPKAFPPRLARELRSEWDGFMACRTVRLALSRSPDLYAHQYFAEPRSEEALCDHPPVTMVNLLVNVERHFEAFLRGFPDALAVDEPPAAADAVEAVV
jgi:hypothetical protein